MLVSALHAWLMHQRPGRPDHQRHRHQHHRARADRLSQPPDQADRERRARSIRSGRPTELVDLPIVGWVFRMFLAVGPITMSVIVLVIVMQILLFRSRWGLRTRAVGEHPRAADTVGIDVIRLRYRNVILGGIFAGPGRRLADPRVQPVVPERDDGQPRVHRAGRGHLRPLDADRGLRRRPAVHVLRGPRHRHPVQPTAGRPRASSCRASRPPIPSLYNNAFGALPYLLTIIVLAGVVGRSVAPAAVGTAVRQGRRLLTNDEDADRPRQRTVAFLDLQEGRGPVPAARRPRHRGASCRSTRRIAVIGASSDPGRPSFGVFRYLVATGFDCVPGQPERAGRASASRPSGRSRRRSNATGPFDMVDVFRRSELCVPHAHEAVAVGARCLWLQLGVVNWEAAHDRGRGRPCRRDGPLHRDRVAALAGRR